MSARAAAWSPGALGPLLADDAPDLSWQDAALCAQVGGDLWFPEKGDSVREAKAICRRCPARAACLEYALEHGEQWGIWAGLTERELRAYRLLDAARPAGEVLAEADAHYFERRRRAAASQVRRLAAEREARALKAKELAA